jgi:hypothetical protein
LHDGAHRGSGHPATKAPSTGRAEKANHDGIDWSDLARRAEDDRLRLAEDDE